jgi:hypothetical protein
MKLWLRLQLQRKPPVEAVRGSSDPVRADFRYGNLRRD